MAHRSGSHTLRRTPVVLFAAGAIGVGTLVILSAWPLAIALAVSAAVAWCVWLERHPE